MDKPVVALVLLVVGLAAALAVAAIASGYLIFWQRKPSVMIESADILIHPHSGIAHVTVHVRNTGGQSLSFCAVTMLLPLIPVDDAAAPNLVPGGVGSFYEDNVTGLTPNTAYIFEVSCIAQDGSRVVDRKTATPHF